MLFVTWVFSLTGQLGEWLRLGKDRPQPLKPDPVKRENESPWNDISYGRHILASFRRRNGRSQDDEAELGNGESPKKQTKISINERGKEVDL